LGHLKPAQLDGEQMSPEQMVEKIRQQQKEIEYLKRQREILEKAMSILGRGTAQRYTMIEELSVQFAVKECCVTLSVSRSGYYQWVGTERDLLQLCSRAEGQSR
jgi:hypothetical protein